MTVIEPHLAPAMRGHTAVPESEARALDRAHREIVGADLSQAPGSESAIGGQVITRPRSTNDLDVLTPREREVLSLVVVPTNVVYSRETGTFPPMPPCGRARL